MKKILAILFLIVGSCSTQSSDKELLMDAQLCLDKASKGIALRCVENISNISSDQANRLRCSAGFIHSGVSSSENLSNIIKISQNDDNSFELISSLSFGLNNEKLVNDTNQSCSKIKDSSMAILGALASISTSLTNLGASDSIKECEDSGCSIDQLKKGIEENVDALLESIEKEGIDALNEEVAIQKAVGIASDIVNVYDSTCKDVRVSEDLCKELEKGANKENINISEIANISDPSLRSKKLEELAIAFLKELKKKED